MRKNALAITALSVMAAAGLSAAVTEAGEVIPAMRGGHGIPYRTTGSSRNGGHTGKGMAAKRASVKRRNVLRNRRAHRGA